MSAVFYPFHRTSPSAACGSHGAPEFGSCGQVLSQPRPLHADGSAHSFSNGEAEPRTELAPPRARQVPRFRSWSVHIAETIGALCIVVAAPLVAMSALAAAVGLDLVASGTLDGVGRVLPLLSMLMILSGGRRLADSSATVAQLALRSTTSALFAASALVGLTLVLSDAVGFVAIGVALIAVAPVCGLAARGALASDNVAQRLRRNVVVYGCSSQTRELIASIEKEPGCRFAGLFDERQDAKRRYDLSVGSNGTLNDLAGLVARGLVDDVILALPPMASARAQQICNRFRELPVDVVAADEEVLTTADTETIDRVFFGGQPMVRIHRRPIVGWGAVVKPAFDRALAGLALIVLAPVFAFIALAIKLESKGPVFFRQRRHGMCGQTIVVWKFRTMQVMEDGDVVRQASKADDRVTRVGRVLRRTSLDELPQLINVLNGSMSIVGPRPHAIAHDEHYGALLPTYSRRSIVRPGITGWAQINGLRGETRTPAEMAARVHHDLWYVANWSFWLDLRIILLTPVYGLVHKNAY